MPNVVDKFTPSYDLAAFKKSKIEIRIAAMRGAANLGFSRSDIHAVIKTMTKKSMTSYQDHHIWQDVYHVPYKGLILYIKFTKGTITDFSLLSFKEK